MRLGEVDRGFVAASPARVFEVLRDPGGYPRWWPGVRDAGDGSLRIPVIGPVRLFEAGVEPGRDLVFRMDGRGFRGELEWYLESFEEGTIVIGILRIESERRWRRRRVLAARAGLHRAMWALKEMLE